MEKKQNTEKFKHENTEFRKKLTEFGKKFNWFHRALLALGDFEKRRVISIHIKAVLQQAPRVTTVRTEENINGTVGATQVDL